MNAKPPPSPTGIARKLDSSELRLGNLRRELEAETDHAIRAAIVHHMGTVYEHELERPDDAADHYSQATATAPDFEPAWTARMRLVERSTQAGEIASLCAARVASAREPAARAAALVDLALRSDEWAPLLREAVALSPEPAVPALILEWLARANRDSDAHRDALRAQAEHASDPTLGACLRLDLALAEIEGGEIDLALDALDQACLNGALAWSARSLQRRIAREHGRTQKWVWASVSMAELLQSGDPSDPLDLPVPQEERLPMAALLWQEAARISAEELDDSNAAASYLASALRALPDDLSLRRQVLHLQANDDAHPITTETADWFRALFPDDPPFLFREVERAVSVAESESSLPFLRELAVDHPRSPYARAALEVALVRSGAVAERITRLCERASTLEGEARAVVLWQAAHLRATHALDDAQSLFVEAANSATAFQVSILRDAFGAAIQAEDAEATLSRTEDLLACEISNDERVLLSLCRYEVTRHWVGDAPAAELLLRQALSDPQEQAWAAHVARARAALTDQPELLAEAHEALASRAAVTDQVAHRCAAGLAYTRIGNWEAAERVLRQALEQAPHDRYVLGLLEHVLREGDRPEEIVRLARSRSERRESVGEISLLLAGAAAERNGNLEAAQEAYEEALRQSPDSPSAALALLDVARRRRDMPTWVRACADLGQIELGGGVSELFALLRADALSFAEAHTPEASRAYERALEHPATTLPGAIALLSTPLERATDEQRAAAEEILADAQAGTERLSNGFDRAYAPLRATLGQPEASTGDSWMELASLAPNELLQTRMTLHGLREMRLSRGEEAVDDLFMIAQRAEALAADHPESAIAIDEMLSPGDDPELRAAVLQQTLRHAGPVDRPALFIAHCRARVEAGDGREAVATLSAALDERPDDLALWETLRGAARQAQEWALVAQACERLARFVEGALKADLLEEAGAVRLDCLQQFQQAEDLFRAALDADPTRDLAFRRLHDLLADREDGEALEALVSARLALGGPKDRPELLYERARLLRGFSDRPGTLEVLEELFGAEPDHVGALALAAEVHVSLEQWEEAVDCLRRLSRSQIPSEQRRVAHLGAADFLDTRLGKKDEALTELRAVEALGLADAETWLRIGALEEALDRRQDAIHAYMRVLDATPTYAHAAARLAELTEGKERSIMLQRYEDAIWKRITEGELDHALLGALREAVTWQDAPERAGAVEAVEIALDAAVPGASDAVDLGGISVTSIEDLDTSPQIEEILKRAGAELGGSRARVKKVSETDPARAELKRLSERFGARFGSLGWSETAKHVEAYAGRDGELHWVIPKRAPRELDEAERFAAGRLAWAVPRGAGALLDGSVERAAGLIAAILRAARCELGPGSATLPAAVVKLRRAVRRSVREAVGDALLTPEALLTEARRIRRAADRAGLVAAGCVGPALRSVLGDRPTVTGLRASERALDLLRFWAAPDSPRWRRNA